MTLSRLIGFDEEISLIARSGIQFVDFGLTLNVKAMTPGGFARTLSQASLVRLDEKEGDYLDPETKR
ncbi:UNVERIFIED_CONTAM: virulence factor SrfB, partial [Salmonella enterica subsp. enterica serovar Weltevreden]